ncbi:flagella basal body P-ring formation protein FlgA [Verminephrobacter aporrectodeae subsp. tuberculatae]|uniref:Flagella basal body P-ring formation protein FlgA n=2 Tax=Verminephrobacter TaxID=364316 RepID=A0ABT3KY70_9BURK|nr:flagellar basal body P-ring formation chaperone FlgA [Verminephrobacter aporrectodeae]MCW5322849.1 flagella basal body P-ring formation protein FlgA [Verminephrobacter aporrectodeae subsp. tuberculatae]
MPLPTLFCAPSRGPAPLRCALWLLGLSAALGGGALAQQGVDDPAPQLGARAQRWIEDALAHEGGQPAPWPLRMQVDIGALDPRLRLAPCSRVEPYLPVGTRLWGRTRLGLRCVAGAGTWNVFLPVLVRAWGPAWVLTRDVAPGAVLGADDAAQAQVDWAGESAPVLAHPDLWVGQTAARPLRAGQALRQNMLRTQNLLPAGAPVKVLARGPGYAVTAAGQALSAGAPGQTVRVRMDSGRIVNAVVRDGSSADLALE